MVKRLALLMAAASTGALTPASGETIQHVFQAVLRQTWGTATPGIFGQAKDQAAPATVYSVRICAYTSIQADGFCPSGTTNSVTIVSDQQIGGYPPNLTHGSGNQYLYTGGTVGSINLLDGGQYYLYPYAISLVADDEAHDLLADFAKTGPTATCCGIPWRWDIANSSLKPDYDPVLTSSTPATIGQYAVIANTSDTYSVGSAGATVCAGGTTANGSTAILNDGVVGYWAAKYSLPCNQIYEIATSSSSESITVAAFNSAFQTVLNSFPSSIQYTVLGFARPTYVTGNNGRQYAISSWTMNYPTTNGVEPTVTACIDATTGVGFGPSNPWYNSGTNSTPFTTKTLRPTIMLAAGRCSGCTSGNNHGAVTWSADVPTFTAVIDAAATARATNPTSKVAQTVFLNNNARPFAYQFPPSLTGSAITKFTTSVVCSAASNCTGTLLSSGTNAGNIGLFTGSSSWNYGATFGFAAGAGFGYGMTSTSGQLNGGGQTPAISWLGGGTGGVTLIPAVAAAGQTVEPCESLPRKSPDAGLFLQYYAAGWNVMQAFWKSQFDGWVGNLIGDPMAQPFAATNPASGTGGSGFTLGGGSIAGAGSLPSFALSGFPDHDAPLAHHSHLFARSRARYVSAGILALQRVHHRLILRLHCAAERAQGRKLLNQTVQRELPVPLIAARTLS